MIKIKEHSIYGEGFGSNDIKSKLSSFNKLDKGSTFNRSKDTQTCYKLFYDDSEPNEFGLESTYIIGVNWVVEGKLPICIEPKLNTQTKN